MEEKPQTALTFIFERSDGIERAIIGAHVFNGAWLLKAARWGEVRWAQWTEMDTEAHVWTVPAAWMTAQREHRVPLCGIVLLFR